jgi:plastocyanin
MLGIPARRLTAMATLALITSACGGDSAAPGQSWTYGSVPPAASAVPASAPAGEPTEAPASTGPSGTASTGETVQLTIGTDAGAALEFDPTTVSAPAGATLQITFENDSAALPHNLTFGEPINQATEPVVEPGGSEFLEFPAPDPGSYQFVCTLHPGMEGTLTVEGQ